jgi:penicillin-binding protein 1A
MSDSSQRPRRKAAKNTFTTKSGKSIKVNRSLSDRMKAGREAKAQRKAAYLSTLPKEPWKRALYRMSPKRLYQYWFSQEGAIMALKVLGIGFVVMFLIIVGLFAYFRKDLPRIKDLNSGDSGGSISYYDRTGKTLLFQDYGAYKRIPVDQSDMSKYMQQATVAIEDKDFYHEGAFNVKGITRAAINNAKGGSTQGGSTITQQLVKLNEKWTSDRTISRKVKELILAVELEREYSKDEILTGYLNMAPYSGQNYGVQAAAQDYFHVDAKDLTLAQSALMAAMPKAPGTLSPYASPTYNSAATADFFDKDGLLSRQAYVLDQMAKQGYITQAQADAAKKVDIIAQIQPKPTDKYAGIKAPYFYQAARDELSKSFPAGAIDNGGWKVVTTLDMNLQSLAEKSVNDNRYLLSRYHADSTAFVAEDNETGQVMALIGGLDFTNKDYGQNNYALRNISPGSSIKPYDYATFINNNTNVGAGSVLYDQIGPLPGYPCTNKAVPEANAGGNCLFDYDRRSPGPTTLRYALGGSRNIPAAKAMLSAVPGDTSANKVKSINKVVDTVSALMGVEDGYRCYDPSNDKVKNDFFNVTKAEETQCYTASAIGDGAYLHLKDHVNGIASLARMGKSVPQTFILKVTNNSGKTLKEFSQPKGTQVLKPDSAYIVSNMAADPKASYLSGSCTETNCSGSKFHRYKGWTNAIKTGTTNDSFDGLMMSWNPKYTAGVWIGNHTRTIPFTTSPENITDPIMKSFMQGAIDQLGDVKAQQFVAPSTIKTASAYVVTNRYLGQSTPSSNTDIFPGWYVGTTKSSSATTDKVSGKLATSCTPSLARQSSYNSNTTVWNVDQFMGGNPTATASANSSAPQASDDVHSCSDSQPSATITAINGTSTNGNSTPNCPATGCVVLVHVEAGTHPLSDSSYPNFPGTLSLLVDGQVVQSQSVNDSGDYSLVYKPDDSNGSVQLEAQVTDSVLYQGTDTKTVNIKSTSAFKDQTTSGGTGGGNGRGRFANALGN